MTEAEWWTSLVVGVCFAIWLGLMVYGVIGWMVRHIETGCWVCTDAAIERMETKR